MRLRKKLVIGSAVIAIGIGVGAFAYASIPDSGGVIHGCYKTSDGKLRVVDSTCASGETSLNWNQTGPVGPQGPVGISNFQLVRHFYSVDLMAGDTNGYNVICPSGTVVISGGYQTGDAVNADFLVVDAGTDASALNNYVIRVTPKPGVIEAIHQITVEATCAEVN